MKLKNILFFSLFLSLVHNSYSQNSSDTAESLSNMSFRDRIQFNIGGGFMIGNTYTNINLLPQVGYRITSRLTAGIGANLQYFKNTFQSPDPFLIYGGNAFTRYSITENLFAQAEYQMLNFRETWGEYAMIGGGYLPGSGFYISAYYLLLYPQTNIYGAPYVIRAGFMF